MKTSINLLFFAAGLLAQPSVVFASEQTDCALLDDMKALSRALVQSEEPDFSSCSTGTNAAGVMVKGQAVIQSDDSGSVPDFSLPNTVWQTDIEAKVGMLDSGFAGETIDVSSGSLSFRHVDVSLPGNSHLPVEFARTYRIDGIDYSGNVLGGWTPDVPYLTLRRGGGGTIFDGEDRGGSCLTGVVVRISTSPYTGAADPIRNNIRMYIPGQGSQPLVKPVTGSVSHPYDVDLGATTGTTPSHWKVLCDGDMSNVPGTAIVAIAPNGDTYTFDTLAKQYAGPEIEPSQICSSRAECEQHGINVHQTYHYNIYASKVVDVHGNQVTYHYDNDGYLTQISANDGRSITIGYTDVPSGVPASVTSLELLFAYSDDRRRIASVTANGRTWSYGYATEADDNFYPGTQVNLRTVTRPDGKQWLLNLPLQSNLATEYFNSYRCWAADRHKADDYFGSFLRYLPSENFIVHPEGTRVDYDFTLIKNAGGILNQWNTAPGSEGTDLWELGFVDVGRARCQSGYYNMTVAKAVTGKTITLKDNTRYQWQYDYEQSNFCPAATVTSKSTKRRTVTAPDGSKTAQHFYCDGPEHGQLARKEVRDSNNILLETATFDYATQTWTEAMGPSNNKFEQHQAKVSQQITQRGSDTFTRILEYNNDATRSDYSYGQPVSISESNNVNSYNRNRTYTWHNDTAQWLLNNLIEVKQDDVSTGRITLDSLARPTHHYRFGTLVGQYTYHASGSDKGLLHTYKDALNRTSTFSGYKRGMAQTIVRPDGNSESRTVDSNGWTTKVTDANSNCTNYQYDSIGRITLVDPCDDVWTNTSIVYSNASAAEADGDVYAGMFKQTLNQGNAQTIHYLDSLLRPVLTQQWDKTSAATKRLTRYEYDFANRVTRASKPFTGAFSSQSDTSAATLTQYDALGRTTLVNDNTLPGSVTYSYQNGNKIQVNDNRGNVTTTTYLAWGSPAYEHPLRIASPENVTTDLVYNDYGNITSITQSGKNAASQNISLTEHRAYDNLQQLCKVSRPDVGQTVYHHDAAGQLLWQAEGTTGGSNSNCTSDAGSSDKVTFTYDTLGNIKSTTFPGTGGFTRTYSYDKNSNVTNIVSGSVTQNYSWNSLNLLTTESVKTGTKTLSLAYGYNALGHISSLTYPDGDTISYAPNALGQPTQARRTRTGTAAHAYASNVSYHPNGAIHSFSYGNGLTHKTTLNTAQLPASIKDSRSGFTALDYQYQYDGNLNVTRLTDNLTVNGVKDLYSLTSLTYDGLDRLTSTTGGSAIGSSSISYDGLGNITRYQSKGHNLNYSYNYGNNRLTGVNDTAGSKDYAFFTYDDRGNITNTSFNALTFNRANQVTSATTTTGDSNSYLYDGHNRRVKKTHGQNEEFSFYSNDGTLLYRETRDGGINYIYLGKKLIAQDGFILEDAPKQHYRPYGQSIEGETDDVGYTGHKFDIDLGLSYMQARYYDPVIGRFYSNDPVGTLEHLRELQGIQGFNRYAYVNNNPYKYTDPNGESAVAAVGTFLAGDAATPDPTDAALGPKAIGYAAAFALAAGIDAVFNESAQDSSNGVTVEDDGSGSVIITVDAGDREIEIIADTPEIEGDRLILDGENGVHISTSDGEPVGLSGMRDAGRKVGEHYGVSEVEVRGGERSSGANVGKQPRPVVIKVTGRTDSRN